MCSLQLYSSQNSHFWEEAEDTTLLQWEHTTACFEQTISFVIESSIVWSWHKTVPQTEHTYGVDTNFVYNSIQAMYAADIVALDLSQSFKIAFVGKSLADVDASTALSFLASKMDAYKKQKLIAGSSDAPLGFKNAKVAISGPVMNIGVEIKLATAIYFIPNNIEISQVSSSAE